MYRPVLPRQVLYKRLMGLPVCLDDLKELHPEVHASLTKLLTYESDLADLGLFFQVRATGLGVVGGDATQPDVGTGQWLGRPFSRMSKQACGWGGHSVRCRNRHMGSIPSGDATQSDVETAIGSDLGLLFQVRSRGSHWWAQS